MINFINKFINKFINNIWIKKSNWMNQSKNFIDIFQCYKNNKKPSEYICETLKIKVYK